MEGKGLILLATLAVAFGGPISQKPSDLQMALASYASWSDGASQAFLQETITSSEVDFWENQGQNAYDALAEAIQTKAAQLQLDVPTQNPDMENTVLSVLQNGLLPKLQPDLLVGLLANSNEFESHGAKLFVSTDLFKEVTGRFRELVENVENEEDIDAEMLMEIVEVLYASEIAFDGMVSNFRSVEMKVLPVENVETESEDETESQDTTESSTLSRRKRQNNGVRLGGGFSTNGRSVTYQRGRTSATLTPHYSVKPRPRFHGASVGATHRFRNGRGSVYGSATVNRRGRVTGGHVGVRIRF